MDKPSKVFDIEIKINDDLKKLRITNWRHMVQNLARWKSYVNQAEFDGSYVFR